MPAGLDGNPNPTRSTLRDAVIEAVTERILRADLRRVLVGVDGRSSSGKSTFADELAGSVQARGWQVIRASTDSFHRPRSERLQQGPTSAAGYVDDSHQLGRICGELLEPFRSGEDDVLVRAFDEPSDLPDERHETVTPESVLIFDGLFVLRPELAPFWNTSVFLEADERCDRAWLDFLLTDLPTGPTRRADEIDRRLRLARWPRYRDGWQCYLEHTQPRSRATFVIDNNDFVKPQIVDRN